MIFDLLNVSAFSDIGIQVYVGIQLFYENWVFISWSKDYSYCQQKYIKLQRYIRLMHEKARFCFLSWNLINFFTAVLWATTLVVRNMLVSWLFLFTYLFFTAAIVLAIFEVGVMMLTIGTTCTLGFSDVTFNFDGETCLHIVCLMSITRLCSCLLCPQFSAKSTQG